MSEPTSSAEPTQPARFLFINDTSRNGGPGKTLVCLLKFLDPKKIHRTVLLPREDIVSQDIIRHHAADELVIEPALIENILQPWQRGMTRQDFNAPAPLRLFRGTCNTLRATSGLMRLIRRVRKEKYSLIFCNGTAATLIGGIVAWATGVPAVWHVFYPRVPAPIRALHRKLAASPGVAAIFCVSAAVSGQFGHCQDKTRVCHDALDLEEFDAMARPPLLRKELGLAKDAIIFGAHGRVIRRKGFIELIQVARRMMDQLRPEERQRCHFVVLGDTPQDMPEDHLEECRELVRSLELEHCVHFIGFRADVMPYLTEFDVVLVPSVYPDPLPRAVMEAMALAKPVVAFNVGGIGEMITDGVDGRLFTGLPPDIAGMADACIQYFRTPTLRAAHGLAGRKRIEKDFEARSHALMLQTELLRLAKR
ncbi:glycosyltransferase [Acetobacter vaccinii]|uniref:Glycosyltransferase family 4 protein n=1 Tax=Acetobacter vaccinii TaxID=2592655 RepID=A0A5C1YNJ9_9PROT|nr:glycosyltransferase [Acetobacter vaccinii]QEO17896.1 glycosyltransferase family 4 protein [Acetobacter vaccinii]